MSVLAFIVAKASTELKVVNHLQQHKTNTESLSNWTLGSRNLCNMNDCMGYVSRRVKEYESQEPED